jgi:hypothetical protein
MSERNAVLEPAHQVFYFSNPDLRRSEFERGLIGERGMRSGKPGTHFVKVAFEQLQGESNETGEANESIGLFGLKPLAGLAPGQGARRDAKELSHAGCWKVQDPAKPLERLER